MMPFGLSNVPTKFMDLINKVLKPFLDQFNVIFINYILIYSKSPVEQEKHLETMLETLCQHKFYTN